jgi:hypothetical protein
MKFAAFVGGTEATKICASVICQAGAPTCCVPSGKGQHLSIERRLSPILGLDIYHKNAPAASAMVSFVLRVLATTPLKSKDFLALFRKYC